jgi:thioredoxin 1
MGEEVLIHVSDENFDQEVLKADKPSIVDFWAPWCGPCRALSPMVEELASTYKDRIKVAKLLDTLIGLVPKDKLEDFAKKGL